MPSFPCVRVRLYLCIHISVHAPFLALFFCDSLWSVCHFFNSAVSVSEVEALFELYKSISSSVVDDGLISKVSLMVFFIKKNILVFSSSVGTLFFFLVLNFSLQQWWCIFVHLLLEFLYVAVYVCATPEGCCFELDSSN